MALSQVVNSCIESLDASKLTGTLPEGMGGSGESLDANSVIRTHTFTIAENVTFAGTENGISAGPVSIASGSTVSITSPSVWTIV
tara:strand:- start:824 stop:1078 length:255 start_codon:yes stop_codon:yes gene_type:complete